MHLNTPSIAEDVLTGQTVIISHPGASQYNAGGIAACGLASLNFVRIAFARVEAGLFGRRLLDDLVSRETSEEIISICAQWQSNGHLEVEEIAQVPLFRRALDLETSVFDIPSFAKFQNLLHSLKALPNQLAALVITRPPEIISCLKLPIEGTNPREQATIFVIFDSHPRPTHPDGAGFILNTSVDAAASHLDALLAVDARLLSDQGFQWQTQLLANFSGHVFVPKEQPVNTLEEMTKAVMDSSLVALAMQAQVAELRMQNDALVRDRQTMEFELEEMRVKYRAAKERHRDKQRQPSSPTSSSHSPRPSHRDAPQPQPAASTSKISDAPPVPTKDALQYFRDPSSIQRPPRTQQESSDFLMAQQMQMEVDNDEFPRLSSRKQGKRREHQPIASSSKARDHRSRKPDFDDDVALATKLQNDWHRKDAFRAREQQREYEAEKARVDAEHAALKAMQQKVFRCPLCLDDLPEDDVALIQNCTHQICRGCMKGYVSSKLTDKIYPIFCPACLAESVPEPGMVTDELVQLLGLTDAEYHILQELQIAALSILIHCRKCKEGVFVDRTEHETAKIIACPLPKCDFIWCKDCQQEIQLGGPTHSCDGTNEMNHLLSQRGWRRCPGCQTPFQKSSGCNHMTCMAPGCNTHFCYRCGEMIVRSALGTEVRAAVGKHYGRCQLFEVV